MPSKSGKSKRAIKAARTQKKRSRKSVSQLKKQAKNLALLKA